MEKHGGAGLCGLPDDLTLAQAAALLRMPRRTVLLGVLSRELPYRRQGVRLVVPARRLLAGFGVPCDSTEGGYDDDR